MEFWRSLNGLLEVTLTSADIAGTLTEIHKQGIILLDVRQEEVLTITFLIRRQDHKKLNMITQKRGDALKITGYHGYYWKIMNLLKRPVLVGGLAILIALGMWVPTRVLFFQVSGNQSVPTRLILEQAAQCGISFGASRRDVRSERMKNALLEAIPQLQWAGVNTNGCVAVISVKERQPTEELPQSKGVSSIVAARDGIIWSSTVTRGNGLCKVGQAVKAGEVLISGYTDCGLTIRGTRAEGEIFARTNRKLSVVIPSVWQTRGNIVSEQRKYGLIIGKKRINFFTGSGISDTTCVKMYKESFLTLPGGFVLPVSLVIEEWTYYESRDISASVEDIPGKLSGFAEEYLSATMIAGQVLSKQESATEADGMICLEGEYACLEMIGQVRNEEIVKPNGTDD